jgi:hypothetical protein
LFLPVKLPVLSLFGFMKKIQLAPNAARQGRR